MKEKKLQALKMLFLVIVMIMFGFTSGPLDKQSGLTADAAAKIKLNKTNVTLRIGVTNKETCQLKVIGTNKKINWSTSDKKIAVVNQKGKVTAKKSGKAIITAKVDNKNMKCKVTVKKESASTDNKDSSSFNNSNEESGGDDHSSTENRNDNVNGQHESDSAYDRLYKAIMRNGRLNKNGDYVISYVSEDNLYGIIYKNETEQFEFIGSVDNTEFVVSMKLDRDGNKHTSIQCMGYSGSEAFEAEASFALADYALNDMFDLEFQVKNRVGYSESYCTMISNMVSDICMIGWQICLTNNTDLTMQDLGFINLGL